MSRSSPKVAAGDAADVSRPVPAMLAITDLHVDFGGVHAVDGATFSLPRGSLTGLIGPNGAGKSSALRLIAGALRPSNGSIVLDGEDVTGFRAHEMARRGVIRTFQLSSEFARLTVLENLMVAAPGQPGATFLGALRGRRSWGPAQRELVAQGQELLEQFRLAGVMNTYAADLSGGQKRLVEIMRAIMARPKLLLLDEPMAGVNPALRQIVEEHLLRLHDDGLTMVMVEHELATVERCCESVIVMAQGRVLSEGTMEELRQREEVLDAYLAG